MRRLLRIAIAGSGALAIAGCGSVITLGPTAPGDGFIIYMHASYAGTSQQLAVDVSDLGDVEGPCVKGDDDSATARWNDCVSSVRVLPGWRATLYRDPGFKGASFTITEDTPNLQQVPGPCSGSFNDCISSIRVARQ
jgi:Peptidase inhibitor family I36